MNGLQGTDWGNKAGLKQASAAAGDRNLNSVTGVGVCDGAGDECAEILHGLNNVLASMLLNAQVLEWKLPSYSRSRRYLHEIERNAQRGGELVKRLLEKKRKNTTLALCTAGNPKRRPRPHCWLRPKVRCRRKRRRLAGRRRKSR